jgi:hypothetical protein
MKRVYAAFDERGIDVVLRFRIGHLEVFFGDEATRTKRRVHKHYIEALGDETREREALCCILGEQPPPGSTGAARRQLIRQCLEYNLLGLGPEVVIATGIEAHKGLLRRLTELGGLNVSQYIGQQAPIDIVDQNSGGWGQINDLRLT